MVSVVYRDLEQNAPRVKWMGITFIDGVAVDVHDPEKIERLRGNRFFTVDGAPDRAPESNETPEPAAPAKRGWPAGRPRKPLL